MLHLENLPLREETAVYTRNRGGAENRISPSCFFLPSPVGQTRYQIDFLIHFLYQSVTILSGHLSDALVLSPIQKLSSKAKERSLSYTCLCVCHEQPIIMC